MRTSRKTTQEERLRIAKECLENGKNYGATALKYQVSYQQARTWTLRCEEQGEAGLEDRRGKRKASQEPRTELERLQIENEQLKHALYMAEMERDLLKKLEEIERGGFLSQVRQGHIYAAVRACHEEEHYPIDKACEVLRVSRAGYYKWASGKVSRRTAQNEELAGFVEHIHNESPDKGYRRIRDDLEHDYGVHVNDKRVLRICRQRGCPEFCVNAQGCE